MSGNSSSQGASGMNTSIVNGYAGHLGLRHPRIDRRKGDTVLRGKYQAELDAAHWDFIIGLADELSQILHKATGRGYSLPPRT